MESVADRLFQEHFGRPPEDRAPVDGEGSRRRMLRLSAGPDRAVAVLGPDARENRAFLCFTDTFRTLGLPVPEVYARAEAEGAYLLEDLGDTTLFRALVAARGAGGAPPSPAVRRAYEEALAWLVRFQLEGGEAIDFGAAYPRADFDRRAVLWDLAYFKYEFLKLAFVPFDEDALETDFERLAARVTETRAPGFVYRDFQSRNVMLQDGRLRFIDYQGGRRGPLAYDVASLLYDGKAELAPAFREHLLAHYLDALAERRAVDRAAFRRDLPAFVLLRILQAMGAYGYLGLYQGKAHFLASIAPAIDNLEGLLAADLPGLGLPELTRVVERLCAREALRRGAGSAARGRLTVRVASFAYAHGFPPDPGGHGGGYVFDCRGLPNPGREAAFAGLTGRDPEVRHLLAGDPAVEAFFRRTLEIVVAHAEAYLARGFDSLRVLFGCTGGQHRSVYLAERLADALRGRLPGADVQVEHAREDAWPPREPRAWTR